MTVPAVVDRPQFVVSTGANQVRLDEFNRWAAPLQDNLVARGRREPRGDARHAARDLFPQTLATDAGLSRRGRGADASNRRRASRRSLDAVWTVRRAKDGKTETGRTSVRETVQDEQLRRARRRAQPRVAALEPGHRRRRARAAACPRIGPPRSLRSLPPEGEHSALRAAARALIPR